MSAELSDDKVVCSYDRRGASYYTDDIGIEEKKYEKGIDFMVDLQKIVSDFDMARFNGYSRKVHGLPDMFGYILNITYKSGEKIYAYDNQSNRMSLENMEALIRLFCPPAHPAE